MRVVTQVRSRMFHTIKQTGGEDDMCATQLERYLHVNAKRPDVDGLRLVAAVVRASKATLAKEERLLKTLDMVAEVVLRSSYATPVVGTHSFLVFSLAPLPSPSLCFPTGASLPFDSCHHVGARCV